MVNSRFLGAVGVLHLQRAVGNRAIARLLGPASPVALQRVLIPSVTDPSVLQCQKTGMLVRQKGGGVYEGVTDGKTYSYDHTADQLVGGTNAPLGIPFGAPPATDDKPPPGTEVVDVDDKDESEDDTDSSVPLPVVKGP